MPRPASVYARRAARTEQSEPAYATEKKKKVREMQHMPLLKRKSALLQLQRIENKFSHGEQSYANTWQARRRLWHERSPGDFPFTGEMMLGVGTCAGKGAGGTKGQRLADVGGKQLATQGCPCCRSMRLLLKTATVLPIGFYDTQAA